MSFFGDVLTDLQTSEQVQTTMVMMIMIKEGRLRGIMGIPGRVKLFEHSGKSHLCLRSPCARSISKVWEKNRVR